MLGAKDCKDLVSFLNKECPISGERFKFACIRKVLKLKIRYKQASLTSKILMGIFQLRGVFWFFG